MNHGLSPEWLENLPLGRFLIFYDFAEQTKEAHDKEAAAMRRR